MNDPIKQDLVFAEVRDALSNCRMQQAMAITSNHPEQLSILVDHERELLRLLSEVNR